MVFQPATGKLWGGLVGEGAFAEEGGERRSIHCRPLGAQRAAIASKSHYNQATDDYLAEAIGLCDHARRRKRAGLAGARGKAGAGAGA